MKGDLMADNVLNNVIIPNNKDAPIQEAAKKTLLDEDLIFDDIGNEDAFTDQKTIDIVLHYVSYKVKKDGNYIPVLKVLEDEELLQYQNSDKFKNKIKVIKTTWATVSWAINQEIVKAAMKFNYQTNQNELDIPAFRDMRLKKLLLDWDFKDKTGNPVPRTNENISKLNSDLANALLNKYENITNISPEQLAKNLTSSLK